MKPLLHRVSIALLACTVLLCGILPAAAPAGDVRIAVLLSHDRKPYREALMGFQAFLKEKGMHAEYELYTPEGDHALDAEAMKGIQQENVDLIYSLGGSATRLAVREWTDTPVVAGLVLHRDALEGARNATGVYLEQPVGMQLEWLKRLLPEARSVGVIYNPEENRRNVAEAKDIAEELGMKLVAYEVTKPQELPGALRSVLRRADVLWSIPDRLVLNPKTARQILLSSFRQRIPVTGLSSAWVKAGALYSLESNYKDMGAQCGGMAFRLLTGSDVGSVPARPGRQVVYSLNLKTARHMNVEFPDEIIAGAAAVFSGG